MGYAGMHLQERRRTGLSTVELVTELEGSAASPAPPVAATAQPLPQSQARLHSRDCTLAGATGLLLTDGALAALTLPLPALWLAAPLLALYAGAGLYPGYGMLSAERLRRRWLLGAPVLLGALETGTGAALGLLLFLLLAPLTEAFTRHALWRLNLWGKPARVLGELGQMLQQNWYLGLVPDERAADTVIVTSGAQLPQGARTSFLASRDGLIARITPTPTRLERALGRITPRNPQAAPYRQIRRAVDVTASLALLTLTAPLVGLCMLAIYIADSGPVIFSQFRRSEGGNPVRIYKLRSMYENSLVRLEALLASDAHAAASWAQRFKLQPDPRVLPVIGWFVRTFSIDEIPQLINVLRGELSLIGPRAFVDYDLEVYPPELLQLRYSIPAGLTGLWQVSVRSNGINADKVRYDAAYIRSWSLWQDADILYRTVGAVLTGRGAG